MRLETDEDNYGGINLMPLIDVVFLLLIFFLAATTFPDQEVELNLRLPDAKSGSAGKSGNQLLISLLPNDTMTMEGRTVTMEALRQKLDAAVARDKEQAVLIRGASSAQFGIGLQVLDTCRLAKIKKVNFAAEPANKD
jgi:biopolymer transport protein ExbD